MPRYFITSDDGKERFRDEDGLEFPHLRAAKDDAQRALSDMAREHLPNGSHADFTVRVETEAGDEIYRASLTFDGDDKSGSDGDEQPADLAPPTSKKPVVR